MNCFVRSYDVLPKRSNEKWTRFFGSAGQKENYLAGKRSVGQEQWWLFKLKFGQFEFKFGVLDAYTMGARRFVVIRQHRSSVIIIYVLDFLQKAP